jgi:hypothetical protein
LLILGQNNEYYDMTLEKTKLIFEGQSIFSTLEGVYQHFLRPKKIETTLEWGSRVSLHAQCVNKLTPLRLRPYL